MQLSDLVISMVLVAQGMYYMYLSCYVPCSVSPLSLPAVQGCSVRGHVLEVFLGPEDASSGDTERRLIDVTGLSPGALIITRIP